MTRDGEDWQIVLNQDDLQLVSLGYIFPGMINLHVHPAYNSLPLWHPPQRYDNRYQWARVNS